MIRCGSSSTSTPRERGYGLAFSRRDAPELYLLACPLDDERAQGRPGARCTRGLVCICAQRTRTRAYRSSGEHPAFPAQWLDGLCRALPGDEFLLPPSPCELTAKPEPGWANFVFAKLDASHGRQDHTVLPYATTSLVLRRSIAHSPKTKLKAALRSLSRATLFASTAPRTPRIVTTRTPLFMRRDDAMRASISEKEKRIIFGRRSGRPKSR
jgi:hypothetical protein